MDDQKQEDNLEKEEDSDGCGWTILIALIALAIIGLVALGIVRYWRWLGKTIGSGSFGLIVFFTVLGIIFDIIFSCIMTKRFERAMQSAKKHSMLSCVPEDFLSLRRCFGNRHVGRTSGTFRPDWIKSGKFHQGTGKWQCVPFPTGRGLLFSFFDTGLPEPFQRSDESWSALCFVVGGRNRFSSLSLSKGREKARS